MKFDTIIIGGGLSGMTCGIKLAAAGQKCAVVSSGQSALHFFSGSFDLLNYINDKEVENPLTAIKQLPPKHPYHKIGHEKINNLVKEVQAFLTAAGLNFVGDYNKNHFALTPMGKLKPTWLTLNDFDSFLDKNDINWGKTLIVNISGFLDFNTKFIANELNSKGIETQVKNFSMIAFEKIRQNPSEMRATNIAKVFENEDILIEFANKCNELGKEFEHIVLPDVFGLFDMNTVEKIKNKINKPISLIPVIPPSVAGIRSQIALKKTFQKHEGLYLLGDTVLNGNIENNKLTAIYTEKHEEIALKADNFVLAGGSFYGKGIIATKDKIIEPILQLDVDADHDRELWFDKNIFANQAYMTYGVKTDNNLKTFRNGECLQNVYAVGSILSGANSLKEGSGAGVSILSSLYVAEQILK